MKFEKDSTSSFESQPNVFTLKEGQFPSFSASNGEKSTWESEN